MYPALERQEGSLLSDLHESKRPLPLKVDADEDRAPRTMEEMAKEANWLRSFFAEQGESTS